MQAAENAKLASIAENGHDNDSHPISAHTARAGQASKGGKSDAPDSVKGAITSQAAAGEVHMNGVCNAARSKPARQAATGRDVSAGETKHQVKPVITQD